MPAVIFAAILWGCAGPLKQANSSARESYRSHQFKDGFNGARAALLTATVDSGSNHEEYRKILSDIVEEIIKKERKDINIIPLWESLSIINQAGLTADYSQMLKDYAPTGILDKVALTKLKNAIGVSFFIQPKLVDFTQKDNIRFNPFGLTIMKTREVQVKVYIELWNAETGEILWVGVGEATVAIEDMRAKPISFEEVARLAVENVIQKLP